MSRRKVSLEDTLSALRECLRRADPKGAEHALAEALATQPARIGPAIRKTA